MDELTQYWDFYECGNEESPERLCDKGVEKIGLIRVALRHNELALKKRRMNTTKGGTPEPIRIKLEFTFGSKIGVLEVHAFHGRTQVGHTDIEYARTKGRLRPAARGGTRQS